MHGYEAVMKMKRTLNVMQMGDLEAAWSASAMTWRQAWRQRNPVGSVETEETSPRETPTPIQVHGGGARLIATAPHPRCLQPTLEAQGRTAKAGPSTE